MALNLHFLHHITYNILCPFLHFWFSIWSKQHFIYIMSSSLRWSCSLCSVSSWAHSIAELKAACGRCRHGCIFGNTFISTLNAYLHSEQPLYLFESQSIWLFSLCLPHCSLVALSFSVFPWSLSLYFSLSWRFTTCITDKPYLSNCYHLSDYQRSYLLFLLLRLLCWNVNILQM